MLKNLSKILVVDNEQREINKITKALNELNIPAYTLLYSQVTPPERPFTGIRLAFFDIKLQDGNHVDIQTITSFENAIKRCIDVDNGPFILIFWSSHTDRIDDIKRHISERIKDRFPTPILIDSIDKTIAGNPVELKAEIVRILSNDIIEILFDYDTKVSQAAGKSLETLFNVVSNGDDIWGESKNFEENFDLVFSNIAFESLGFNNAKENPIDAVRDGLHPILINELNNIVLTDKWIDRLKHLTGTKQKHEFKKISQQHISQLNSIYHINLNTKILKLHRGAVVNFKADEQTMFDIFGEKISQIRHSFLPFNNEIKKTDKNRIKADSKFILLETSAACDFAQNNPRNHSFILGLLIPAFDLSYLHRKSEAIIVTPFFSFKGNDFVMFFNSRYTFNCSPNGSELLGEPLFQLKNELLNKIITQYSTYISRLGLIQF